MIISHVSEATIQFLVAFSELQFSSLIFFFFTQEDRRDAISHMNALVESSRGNPVVVISVKIACLEHIFHVHM